jgi:hypothetical protein
MCVPAGANSLEFRWHHRLRRPKLLKKIGCVIHDNWVELTDNHQKSNGERDRGTSPQLSATIFDSDWSDDVDTLIQACAYARRVTAPGSQTVLAGSASVRLRNQEAFGRGLRRYDVGQLETLGPGNGHEYRLLSAHRAVVLLERGLLLLIHIPLADAEQGIEE